MRAGERWRPSSRRPKQKQARGGGSTRSPFKGLSLELRGYQCQLADNSLRTPSLPARALAVARARRFVSCALVATARTASRREGSSSNGDQAWSQKPLIPHNVCSPRSLKSRRLPRRALRTRSRKESLGPIRRSRTSRARGSRSKRSS